MPFGEASCWDQAGEEEEVLKKMTGDSSVEYSFKNKGPAKTQALPLVPILFVQNSIDVGEAGVEGITAAAGTCKESLNRSWGCSDKILRCSSQYSVSTKMEHSNVILAEFRDSA